MASATIRVPGWEVTVPLSAEAPPRDLVPMDGPAGEPTLDLVLEGGPLTARAKLNGKNDRKMLERIAEQGTANVSVVLQGNLRSPAAPGNPFLLESAGFKVNVKAPRPTEPAGMGPSRGDSRRGGRPDRRGRAQRGARFGVIGRGQLGSIGFGVVGPERDGQARRPHPSHLRAIVPIAAPAGPAERASPFRVPSAPGRRPGLSRADRTGRPEGASDSCRYSLRPPFGPVDRICLVCPVVDHGTRLASSRGRGAIRIATDPDGLR
jgi:hypothetical protein